MLATGMLIVASALAAAQGPSGVWIGQDGHDRVGPSSEVKPSDVQDIHIVLDGLPPAQAVVQAVITGQGCRRVAVPGEVGTLGGRPGTRSGVAPGRPLPGADAGRDGPPLHGQAALRRRHHVRVRRPGTACQSAPPDAQRCARGDLGRPGAGRPGRIGAGGRSRRPPGCPAGPARPLAGIRGPVGLDRGPGRHPLAIRAQS